METAISVERLSKRYRIGGRETGPDSLVGQIGRVLFQPIRGWRNLRRLTSFTESADERDVIWALCDVGFEVKRGERMGVIGRNGAGKSTLLKILARITEPTSGTATVWGRVSSLLEVGTGFHPELTGRENVYLNGTILGMTRGDVKARFDEIVDFSGVEKFIDTPVKRYSSGMTVRLAFSVAAHLEPEILIVDEVLAVGDAEFQRKCLGKMGEMAKGGRTVLFVSHNMGAIKRLCTSAVLLEDGKVEFVGDPDVVVDRYLSRSLTMQSVPGDLSGRIDLTLPEDQNKILQIRRIRLLGHLGQPAVEFDNRFPITVEIEVTLRECRTDAYIGCVLYGADDMNIFSSSSHDLGQEETLQQPGRYTTKVELPGNVFNAGWYRVGVAASLGAGGTDRYDFSFQLSNGQPFGTTHGGHRVGALLVPLKWEITREVEPL